MAGYKFLEISTQYDKYLSYYYQNHPEYVDMQYDELMECFLRDGFAEAGHIHKYLREMGIESSVIFYNNRNLQNKSKLRKEDQTFFELLIEQIKEYKPSVLYITDISAFSKQETIELSTCIGKNIFLTGYDFCIPHSKRFLENALLYDQLYTGNSYLVDEYRSLGIKAYLLRHAFEPGLLECLRGVERKNIVCFGGSINIGGKVHISRLEMLNALKTNGIPFRSYSTISGMDGFINKKYSGDELYATTEKVKYLKCITNIIDELQPSVFGLDYYRKLYECRISINMHSPLNPKGAGNMRMLEATGIGSCLLTDKRKGNSEFFEPDLEIVEYSSYEELVDKARWLIDNPKEAEKIARAGQARTINHYTYKNKAVLLDENIKKILK